MIRRACAAGVVAVGAGLEHRRSSCASSENDDTPRRQGVTNWSGTHEVSVPAARFFAPRSTSELASVVAAAHAVGYSIRPVGNALSPNAIGLSSSGMVSVANMDRVLSVDVERREVKVEAGVSVGTVLHELRQHGLTLQNFSSITEQQVGGWTQVAAHGTGCTLPTVEEMIVRMTLVTPALGPLELSETSRPELFRLAKCGLGALGVVADLTLRCAPAHRLRESTSVLSHAALRGERGAGAEHLARLRDNRHVRYMWMPHTDQVVVVVANATEENKAAPPACSDDDADGDADGDADHDADDDADDDPDAAALHPMRALLQSSSAPGAYGDEASVRGLTLMQLRGELLDPANFEGSGLGSDPEAGLAEGGGAPGPLSCAHVARVNAAEARAWSALSASQQRGEFIFIFICTATFSPNPAHNVTCSPSSILIQNTSWVE